MTRRLGIALAILSIAGTAAAGAQDSLTYSIGLAAGLGGALDESESAVDHSALQVSAAMRMARETWTVVRLGRIGVDDDESIAGRLGADLEYATISGEYRFRQPAYDFGLSLGLGYYRLEGEAGGFHEPEEAPGLVLAFAGVFDVTRHVAFSAEFDVHYAFLDDANVYGVGLVGLAVQF